MTEPPTNTARALSGTDCLGADCLDIDSLYQSVSSNPAYGQYVRIPARICRCLDHFRIDYQRHTVVERLHAYYLFIGVVDDALDTGGLSAGRDVLQQLSAPGLCFGTETLRSPARLVTEVLKSQIRPEAYPSMLEGFEQLYAAVVRERQAATIAEYICERKRIGHLTAELSYLHIEPFISRQRALHPFLTKVGAVGCLVDSLLDLRADYRNQIISFQPAPVVYLRLAGQTFYEGLQILLKRPRLLALFLEAINDDWRDTRRVARAEA